MTRTHAPRFLFGLALTLGLPALALAQGLDGPPGPAIEPAHEFEEITRAHAEPLGGMMGLVKGTVISVTHGGRVTAVRLPEGETAKGQATAQELSALREAVTQARFDLLPARISPDPAEGARVDWTFAGGRLDGVEVVGVAGHFNAQPAAKVRPVDAALDAIQKRVLGERPTFELARLQLMDESLGLWQVEVQPNGQVAMSVMGSANDGSHTGTASPEQLQRLNAAIAKPDRSQVPTQLPLDPAQMQGKRLFVLQLRAVDPSRSVETQGVVGETQAYAGQLDEVIGILSEIGGSVGQPGAAKQAQPKAKAQVRGMTDTLSGPK